MPRLHTVRVGTALTLLASSTALAVGALLSPAAGVTAPAPGTIDTIAGGLGGSVAANVAVNPAAVAFASPTVMIVADPVNHVVRRVDTAAGTSTVIAGTGGAPRTSYSSCCYGPPVDAVPALTATLYDPSAVAVGPAGDIYIATPGSHRVWRLDGSGMLHLFAGTGQQNTSPSGGDGGLAINANISTPGGLAVDTSGRVIIAETGYAKVRRVAADGTISTIAGTGTSGYSGDNGPAGAALLSTPTGVAVDPSNNVYIADMANHRVRKITGGTISTVVGNGTPGFGGDGGAATAAQLFGPRGVAADGSGNVYVSDNGNHRVRKLTAGTVSTVAGTGAPGIAGVLGDGGQATNSALNSPDGIAATGNGIVALADRFNNRVRMFNVGSTIGSVLGNGHSSFSGDAGPAVAAQLGAPSGVAADANGNVFVADTANHRIRKIDSVGGITTIAGTGAAGSGGDGGPAIAAQFSFPTSLVLEGNDLYISDTGNNTVRKISGGTITRVAGTGSAGFAGDGGPAVGAALYYPGALATHGGSLFIADTGNRRVRKVTAGTIVTVVGNGTEPSGSSYSATPVGDGGPATAVGFFTVGAIAIDATGSLFFVDAYRVRKVDSVGVLSTTVGRSLGSSCCYSSNPAAIPADNYTVSGGAALAFDASGAMLIAEGNSGVARLSSGVVSRVGGNGNSGFKGDGWLATQAEMSRPAGLAVDGSGTVFVADSGNNRVRALRPGSADGFGFHGVTPVRILDTRDGTGGITGPVGTCTTKNLTVSGANGVPAGATAVVLNLTITATTADSFLAVNPKGTSSSYYGTIGTSVGFPTTAVGVSTTFTTGNTVPPSFCYSSGANTSTMNWSAGSTLAHQTISRIGDDGQVSIYNNSGNVQIIADLVGWYDSGAEGGDHYNALPPARILDSRNGTGGFSTPWGTGVSRDVGVTGVGGVPVGATAAVVNLTVTQPSAGSHLTLWPTGQAKPTASNINFGNGQTLANLAVVKLGAGGKMSVFNNSGSVHVILDVVGYFSTNAADTLFIPVTPERWVDTRSNYPFNMNFPMGPGATSSVRFAGARSPLNGSDYPGAIPTIPADAKSVAVNVTVTGPTASGFLTLWPTGSARPTASNINFVAGQTIANLAIVKVSPDGRVDTFNASGSTHVIIDVVGYFV